MFLDSGPTVLSREPSLKAAVAAVLVGSRVSSEQPLHASPPASVATNDPLHATAVIQDSIQ